MLRLSEIYDTIEATSGGRAAPFCEQLVDATEQLREYPFSGAVIPEDGGYRHIVVRGYRIIYRVDDQPVYVMTVVAPGMVMDQAL